MLESKKPVRLKTAVIRRQAAKRKRKIMSLLTELGDHGQTGSLNTEKSDRTGMSTYNSLESSSAIRLIILGHGARTDPVQCFLVHCECSDQPYEALSYEWGPITNEEPAIILDGCYIKVRENLHAALVAIRLEDRDRHVWVDALCIDQQNFAERTNQVQMMGKIYQQAFHVMIWLGPSNNKSDQAMDNLANFKVLPEPVTRSGQNAYEQLFALCDRSYWRRAWIQQEIYYALHLTIHCGDRQATDQSLDDCLSFMPRNTTRDRHSNLYCSKFTATPAHVHYVRRVGLRNSFNPLWTWIRVSIRLDFQASEPRDHIYAMLGISNDCRNGEIVLDYGKPLHDVYLEVMAKCKPRKGPQLARELAKKLGLTFDKSLERQVAELPDVPDGILWNSGVIEKRGLGGVT